MMYMKRQNSENSSKYLYGSEQTHRHRNATYSSKLISGCLRTRLKSKKRERRGASPSRRKGNFSFLCEA